LKFLTSAQRGSAGFEAAEARVSSALFQREFKIAFT